MKNAATIFSQTHPWIELPANMPTFMRDVGFFHDAAHRFEGLGLTLWCDAVKLEDRFDDCAPRFHLCQLGADEDWICDVLSTDDWTLMRGVLCLAAVL